MRLAKTWDPTEYIPMISYEGDQYCHVNSQNSLPETPDSSELKALCQ